MQFIFNEFCFFLEINVLTVLASVGSTNSRYSTSSRYDKLVCIAVAVVAIGLFQHHRYEIQPYPIDENVRSVITRSKFGQHFRVR